MHTLSASEKMTYDEHGFLVRHALVTTADIASIHREIDGLHERMAEAPAEGVHVSWEEDARPGAPRLIRQLMHSEVVSPTLNRILRSDAMLNIIEDLIGPDISLYHSKLLMKAAGDGSSIPWHQDYAYWKQDANRPLMINCQIAIDESAIENGCLEFVPGSHRWGLQEHQREKRSFGVFLDRYKPREDAVPVPLKPGDGVFFSSLIVHGSRENVSARDRKMNTFAYNVTGNGADQCREVLRGRPM